VQPENCIEAVEQTAELNDILGLGCGISELVE
jgi:hypothetical protein